MARSMRASQLETRTARLKLAVRKKPDWVKIAHGAALGYRRNQGPGTWSVRVANGKGGHWIKVLAIADDFDDANGGAVLDFWQAQERARALGLSARHGSGDKLMTVAEAVAAYEADLKNRDADVANAARIRAHLPDTLAAKTVATLAARDFKPWRDALTDAGMASSSINRCNTALRACLNRAADQDERISNARAWEKALAGIPDATVARNVIITDLEIRAVTAAAYDIGFEFGLLVEVAAVTGARVSQLARLTVGDVQAGRDDPRLMVPTSRKGRGRKHSDRRPVPISVSMAVKLRAAAQGRADDAPLLIKSSGEPWKKSNHAELFARAVASAGITAPGVTIYSLRHSSITRQLLAGTPIRVCAVLHDTSTTMIEKTYSRHIADHSDSIVRRALLDVAAEPAADANVIPLPVRS